MKGNDATTPAPSDDPLLWLEDVDGARALDWVRAENAVTMAALGARAEFAALKARLLAILDSKERIPWIMKRGPFVYNFWQDEAHIKGLWRRTTLDDYKRPDPAWETVLDVDRLAADEKENWVWKGPVVREPDYERALIGLSRGGGDAAVLREFDLVARRFIDPGAEGGFALPEAKSYAAWRGRDTLYVATDFGPDTLTTSGYARIVKEWRRGTPLAAAKTVLEAERGDMMAYPFVSHDRGHVYEGVLRNTSFYRHEYRIRRGDAWVAIDCPADANLRFFADYIMLELRSDWSVAGKTYPAGALLAAKFAAYLAGSRDLEMLFEPGPRKSLAEVGGTKSALILNELENVRNRLYILKPGTGGWTRERMNVSDLGSASVHGLDPDESDDYLLTFTGFTEPTTLSLGALGGGAAAPLKRQPALFDAAGLTVAQFEATSRDGTRIPYFQVAREGLAADGRNPTLLYGYGGFEVSLRPGYDASNGAGWLEKCGTYVVANIRGGGEFGPPWHQAALRENRQRAYDDFIAVAEDLVRRGVTAPRHLGIEGGSNGGLLMGVMLTQRPDLFGAVVCQVPLLDMARYHTLLAGASWMEEYGDPARPEDWAYIARYSPYHNLAAGRAYPRVLFMTSTRDDRVHPGHARKMAARMKALRADVLYYENIEGGHGGAADNPQRALMQALAFTFLWRELK